MTTGFVSCVDLVWLSWRGQSCWCSHSNYYLATKIHRDVSEVKTVLEKEKKKIKWKKEKKNHISTTTPTRLMNPAERVGAQLHQIKAILCGHQILNESFEIHSKKNHWRTQGVR